MGYGCFRYDEPTYHVRVCGLHTLNDLSRLPQIANERYPKWTQPTLPNSSDNRNRSKSCAHQYQEANWECDWNEHPRYELAELP